MGHSITQELHEKLERNRREGRLCAGPARHDCATRATRLVVQETWTHQVGEGKSKVSELPMCTRHARNFYAGYAGVNFKVTEVKVLPVKAAS